MLGDKKNGVTISDKSNIVQLFHAGFPQSAVDQIPTIIEIVEM